MDVLKTYLEACHRQSVPKSLKVYEEVMAAVQSGHFAPSEFNNTVLPVIRCLNLVSLDLSGIYFKQALFVQLLDALGDGLECLDLENAAQQLSGLDLSRFRLQRLNLSGNALSSTLKLPKSLKVLEVRATGVTSLLLAGAIHTGLYLLDCSDNNLRQDFYALALRFVQIGLRSAVLRSCGLNQKCLAALKQKTWALLDVSGNYSVSSRELYEFHEQNVSFLVSLV